MIGGIVLTHGQIGDALIDAAASILGVSDNVTALSTASLSFLDINAKLNQVIAAQDRKSGTIVMVSLKGGGCWNSALALARQLPKVEVVSGVNLTMLLSFLTKRDRLSLLELAATIKDDGIRGIDRFTIQ